MTVIYIEEWLYESKGIYKNQEESPPAKALRKTTKAILDGKGSYQKALALQEAQRSMTDFRKENIRSVS